MEAGAGGGGFVGGDVALCRIGRRGGVCAGACILAQRWCEKGGAESATGSSWAEERKKASFRNREGARWACPARRL
jgi:hypothetical protein